MAKIAHTCMLVTLNIKQYGGSKQLKVAGEKAALDAGADPEWFKSRGERLSKKAKKKVQAIVTLARKEFKERTRPWFDSSYIIKATELADLEMHMKDYKMQFEDTVAKEIIKKHADLEDLARKKLGTAFDELGFPTASELNKEYCYTFTVNPIPDIDDLYLEGMPEAQVRKIKATVNEDQAKRVKAAVTGLVEDLANMAKTAALVLADEDKGYHDTLFTNVISLADRVPALNITNDPELNRVARNAVKTFSKYDPRKVKKDAKLRKKVAKEAKSVSDALINVSL